MTMVSNVAVTPTKRLTRDPHTNWAATDRPRLSVPIGNARLGDAHTGLMIESTALSPDCGLMTGASRP